MKREEIWEDIPGYGSLYQVSNMGRVKGLPRKVNNHTGFIQLKERLLKGHPITKGYIQIQLPSRPNRVLKLIHVLVAQCFIPNPNNYPQVNHINGNKADNRAENLEWCDNSMNQLHAYAHGLNWRRENAGKPKRRVRLIHSKSGEALDFDSRADAARYLGGKKHHIANLGKVLSSLYPGYKTIYGYYAEYIQ
ncbi:MAG: NUMOD4 motif-containing HNH endonuclease [Bacteroides acidifaciens]